MAVAEHLKVGTITCDQTAFQPVDLFPLLGRSSRGSNRALPGAEGQRANPPVQDQIDVTLTWVVDGRVSPAGTAHASSVNGVRSNLAYYKSAFFDQADSSGLTAGTLTLSTGTLTANIQCWDWEPVYTGPMSATVVTRIVVPAGEWT